MHWQIPWLRTPRAVRPSRNRACRPLGIESLEGRLLLTDYTVTAVQDLLGHTAPGEVTLRDVLAAIHDQAPSGNAPAGTATNTIRFAIGTPGSVQTIQIGSGNVSSGLPTINHQVFIDGRSQGGSAYSGPPLIVLNGTHAGTANGLQFDPGSDSSAVRGLVIQQFNQNGIELNGVSNIEISGNYIGTDPTGTVAAGNGNDGIFIHNGASNNTVGGTAAGSGNLIAGRVRLIEGEPFRTAGTFALETARISGDLASFDVLLNYTDTPPAEMVFLGIDVRNSSSQLAPIDPGSGEPDFSAFDFVPSNLFSQGWERISDAFPGVFLYHTPPSGSNQPPNGLDPNQTYLVGTITYDLAKFGIQPNAELVVSIAGTDTTIGSQDPADPTTFQFIDPGFSPGDRSVIESAGNVGIEIKGHGTDGNVVLGNRIGTNVHGTSALGGLAAGVFVHDGATGNTIGGMDAGSGNIIAFNGTGIIIGSSELDIETTHNSILGNRVFGNDRLGIDLGNQGATTEGANPRAFPNDGQNPPVITSQSGRNVSGTLDSESNTVFRIEFFAASLPGAAVQQQTFLGFTTATTNGAGQGGFSTRLPVIPNGMIVTATATNLSTGSTSEFAQFSTRLEVVSNPTVVPGKRSQVVTLTARLLFVHGAPLTSGEVTFEIDGLPGLVTGRTNRKGVVSVEFTVPADVRPGRYTIRATFRGGEVVADAVGGGILTVPDKEVPPPPPPSGRVGRRWAR